MVDGRALTRRGAVKSSGVLVVGFAMRPPAPTSAFAPSEPSPSGPVAAADLEHFIAIHGDGLVTVYTSQIGAGNRLRSAYLPMAAEELGIPLSQFTVLEGPTVRARDQGGVAGHTPPARAGTGIRHAAATARRALLDLAATELGRPSSDLSLTDGEVRAVGAERRDEERHVTVASLIGAKRFSIAVDPDAPLRCPSQHPVVTPMLRIDLSAPSVGGQARSNRSARD